MKTNNKLILALLLGIIISFLLPACNNTSDANEIGSVVPNDKKNEAYNLEDFCDIIIGETTYKEIIERFTNKGVVPRAIGFMSEYPLVNGKYIRLYFEMKDTINNSIVSDIQIYDNSILNYSVESTQIDPITCFDTN